MFQVDSHPLFAGKLHHGDEVRIARDKYQRPSHVLQGDPCDIKTYFHVNALLLHIGDKISWRDCMWSWQSTHAT